MRDFIIEFKNKEYSMCDFARHKSNFCELYQYILKILRMTLIIHMNGIK